MLCELHTLRYSIFYMMTLGFSCISQFSAPQFFANACHKRHYITWKTDKEGCLNFLCLSNSSRNTAKSIRIYVRQQGKMQLRKAFL